MHKQLDVRRACRLVAGAVSGMALTAVGYTVAMAPIAVDPWWIMLARTLPAAVASALAFSLATFFMAYLVGGVIGEQAVQGWGRLLAGAGITTLLAAIALTLVSPGWGPVVIPSVIAVALLVTVFAGLAEVVLARRSLWLPAVIITAAIFAAGASALSLR